MNIKVDVVVFATGFDTSFMPHFEVIGRNGANLREQFGDFPKGYLNVTVPNFPNLFREFHPRQNQYPTPQHLPPPSKMLTLVLSVFVGPNCPASHSSLLPILEWYTRYMFQMVDKLQTENIKAYEPKKEAVHELQNHTHELMKQLAWSSACSSWFKNKKTHGPVTVIYPGSWLHFFEMLKNVRYEGYEITYWTKNRFQFMGNGYTECEIDPEGGPGPVF
jgi:hypothetical protein